MSPRSPSAAGAPPDEPRYAPAVRVEALREANRGRRRRWTAWLEWAKMVQVALVVSLLVRALLVEAFKIPSGSMEGTLLVGDFLLVNKLVYGAEIPLTGGKRLPAVRQPALGDVIVFQWPEDTEKNFVKRLVGMPGDTLAMRHGTLYRNGRAQQETYALRTDPAADVAGEDFRWQRGYLIAATPQSYHPSRNNWGPLVVPARHYFVLGDNRDNSLDSRYWGFVPDTLVRGTPLIVYFSYAPDTAGGTNWFSRVRWNRLGERIR
jgi:signal peptidase I